MDPATPFPCFHLQSQTAHVIGWIFSEETHKLYLLETEPTSYWLQQFMAQAKTANLRLRKCLRNAEAVSCDLLAWQHGLQNFVCIKYNLSMHWRLLSFKRSSGICIYWDWLPVRSMIDWFGTAASVSLFVVPIPRPGRRKFPVLDVTYALQLF